MNTPLRLALIALLAPTLATAGECEFAQDRTLELDLDGVSGVRFEVNANELHLSGAGDAAPSFTARACAAPENQLDNLVLSQRREGDVLVIRAERKGQASGIFFKPTYAYLELRAALPTNLPYDVAVGSGDAWISDLRTVTVDVGSGDVEARNISGTLDVKVGSGDVSADGIGQLTVRSVNSGDVDAIRISGDVRVGSIGSGDVSLKGVAGSVEIDSIGSGDAEIEDVSGNLRVARVGSGDVSRKDVRGRIDVPTDD